MAAARKGRTRTAASAVGGRPWLRSGLRLACGLLACAAALTLLERYVWLGAGRDASTPSLHSPHYDFNDDVLAIGASYWVTLAEQELASDK